MPRTNPSPVCGRSPLKTALRLLAATSLLLPLLCRAQAPGPNQTEWEDESLNLRLFYPSDLVKADPAQIMQGGNLALFGVSGSSDPKLADATSCLRPKLLLTLPPSAAKTSTETTAPGESRVTVTPAVSATLLLAELDIECLSTKQSQSTTLLDGMAEIVGKVPGMNSITKPSTYTIGYQKVHMAAAQGQPPSPAGAAQPATPQQLFTMGISTNWNSHLLVWYFSSNNIETLNRITKTTVRFGRAEAAPLYPVIVGNANR